MVCVRFYGRGSASPEMSREGVAISGSCRVLNPRRREQEWKKVGTVEVVMRLRSKGRTFLQRLTRKACFGSTQVKEMRPAGMLLFWDPVYRCEMLSVFSIRFRRWRQIRRSVWY